MVEKYRLGEIDIETLRAETDKLSQLPYTQTGQSRNSRAIINKLPTPAALVERLKNEAPWNLVPADLALVRSEMRASDAGRENIKNRVQNALASLDRDVYAHYAAG